MPTNPTVNRRAVWERLMSRIANREMSAPDAPQPPAPAPAPVDMSVVESLSSEQAATLARAIEMAQTNAAATVAAPPVAEWRRNPRMQDIIRGAVMRMGSTGVMSQRQGSQLPLAFRETAPHSVPIEEQPGWEPDDPEQRGDDYARRTGSSNTRLTTTMFTTDGSARMMRLRVPRILELRCGRCGIRFVQTTPTTRIDGADTCPICTASAEPCQQCHAPTLRPIRFMLTRPTPQGTLSPTEVTSACPGCINSHAGQCNNCGAYVSLNMIANGTCQACRTRAARERRRHRGPTNHIHGYSYKPEPIFHEIVARDPITLLNPVPTAVYMGVEVETELPPDRTWEDDEAVIKMREHAPLFYAKTDGSLTDGIEFVSHPFSWEFINHQKEKIGLAFKELIDRGVLSYRTTTCGMHVHMTRKPLMGDPLLRMMQLVRRSDDIFFAFSRRESMERLDRWASCAAVQHAIDRRLHTTPDAVSPVRYSALNITKHTVECRIFRGTLDLAGFMANLEVCRSLVDFCMAERTGYTRTEYLGYLRSNPIKYPNLTTKLLPRLPQASPAPQPAT